MGAFGIATGLLMHGDTTCDLNIALEDLLFPRADIIITKYVPTWSVVETS